MCYHRLRPTATQIHTYAHTYIHTYIHTHAHTYILTVFVRGTVNGMQKHPEGHLMNELRLHRHGAVLGVADLRIASS